MRCIDVMLLNVQGPIGHEGPPGVLGPPSYQPLKPPIEWARDFEEIRKRLEEKFLDELAKALGIPPHIFRGDQ